MSFEFIPSKDVYLKRGKVYHLFESGDILVEKDEPSVNNLKKCDLL